MIILGIGGILGDAASAIVKNGQLIAAVEEIKVSRQYRVGALPDASIGACLSIAAAKPEDVDLVIGEPALRRGRGRSGGGPARPAIFHRSVLIRAAVCHQAAQRGRHRVNVSYWGSLIRSVTIRGITTYP